MQVVLWFFSSLRNPILFVPLSIQQVVLYVFAVVREGDNTLSDNQHIRLDMRI